VPKAVGVQDAAASQELHDREVIERTLKMVRAEYTVMPRFGYHQPFDYHKDSTALAFEAPVWVDGEPLPLPPIPERMGYSADDAEYLRWGSSDKDLVCAQIEEAMGPKRDLSILDFGCSSGRVLRHFHGEAIERDWKLYGVDIQARTIQWMRENFPANFVVYTGTTLPILPFPDASLDVVYGFSIFTHIKYNWDMWLMELRRVLKPGGLLIQTFHSEYAWAFYYDHRDQDWVRASHSALMLESREMSDDYFYYGDIGVSQVFWKAEVAREYWSRYFEDVRTLPPPVNSFQDWLVCRKA
jgi:SAM-dependent methyltransferase